jgi:hypothetical protein
MTSSFSPFSNALSSSPLPSNPSSVKQHKRPRRRSEKEWGHLLEEHDRSSLSVKDFCALKGIAASNFYKRKRRAVRSALQASPPVVAPPCNPFPTAGDCQDPPHKTSPMGEASPVANSPANSLSYEPLTLRLGPDLALSIPANFHEKTLTKVVALLTPSKEAAPC